MLPILLLLRAVLHDVWLVSSAGEGLFDTCCGLVPVHREWRMRYEPYPMTQSLGV